MLDLPDQIYVLECLVQCGDLHQAHLLARDKLMPFVGRGVVAAIEGTIPLNEYETTLCVGIDHRFPLSLPLIFLRPADALGLIPHVEVDSDGYVCYLDTEGTVLNFSNPLGLLREALATAIGVLQSGVNGENYADFLNEFGAYWSRLCSEQLTTFLTVDQTLRKVFVYENKQGCILVADDLDQVRSHFNRADPWLNQLTRRKALYIPFTTNQIGLPPRRHQPWSYQTVRRIIWQNLSSLDQRRLEKLWKKQDSISLVVLSIPRPVGGAALVGLKFSEPSRHRPIGSRSCQTHPVPISFQRRDAKYLQPRGGVQNCLEHLRVLVVGCGAIGGFVIPLLIQAGIRCLALVDPDTMQVENTFRHYLGMTAIAQPKVRAMQEAMQQRFPNLSITAHQSLIEDALQAGVIRWSEFDLCVIATGKFTIDLHLNRLLHQAAHAPATVFTWLEPYGIGGHALLVHPKQTGCLQCLFVEDLETKNPLHDRSAFAAPNQRFGHDSLGCGSSYTPYSALDAQKTAELAVRLALKAATRRELNNSMLSWRGDAHDFLAAGYRLSPRYQQTLDQLAASQLQYARRDCPICSRTCL